METLVEIKNLIKKFPKSSIPALNNINAQIYKGRINGVIGPDGAGKTTLLRLISGLMTPTSGSITVDNYDTTQDLYKIQEMIGYMPQRFGLYEDLTVLENLELYASLHGLKAEKKQQVFDKMMHFTNLKPFLNRFTGKLSGGMKQKLGLACALLITPKLVVLDEPSVGVDPLSRQELWLMIHQLLEEGVTVIISTSYLDEAERCEQILLLNEGNLIYTGSPKDLISKMGGHVYIIKAEGNERRKILRELITSPSIRDGIVEGHDVRIIVKKSHDQPQGYQLLPVPAKFEDAFIDILGTEAPKKSSFAERMQPRAANGVAYPIQAIGLTKKFGDFTAVKNVSFDIKKGEIFGLLGPNGAGKSVTFKMMCGLIKPNEGRALVSGFDLLTASAKARSRIGYMAQKFSLYSDLSVMANLNFFAGIYGLSGNQKKDKINEMIEVFALEPHLLARSGGLPFGFKQRLALSCAVMHEPDVLFLDEPTSGVDPITRREFWLHINGMVEKGVTIMVTTHFLDEAEYCDNIALIYNGNCISKGTPQELKASVQSEEIPNPILEDAFIELIKRSRLEENNGDKKAI